MDTQGFGKYLVFLTSTGQKNKKNELQKRGIVKSISPRHVGRLLGAADLKPHRSRYWQTPQPDEQFYEKVEEISNLYLTAPKLSQQRARIISTEEKTGIQALERKKPRRCNQER